MKDFQICDDCPSSQACMMDGKCCKPLVPAPGLASDDYTPPPTYRRWQFSCTLSVWALPLCVTRYNCGGLTIQFLCFEMHTDRAHRWLNEPTEPLP